MSNVIHKAGAIHRAKQMFKVLKKREMTDDELERLELRVGEDAPDDMEAQLQIHADGSMTFLSPLLDRNYMRKEGKWVLSEIDSDN